ncbi:hypothetical protein VTJ49DRAFT_5319 [Mycothermus thermophilus]|uniref:HMG box domain-containing protein n=1 Tax=Humicola insolens TaxID=85995 RepID=A0ABR3V3H1_HUMIN
MLLPVASRAAARHVSVWSAHRLISHFASSRVVASRVVPTGFRVVAGFSRTYAARAKAATKKTASSKKAAAKSTKKGATTKKKTATKKAAAKKPAKAKKKKAAKPKAAKKAGRKPKKQLTERQLALLEKKKIRELKQTALLKSPVAKLPESTFTVFFTERKDTYFPKGQEKPNAIEALSKARADFKTLSAAEVERLETTAKTNRAANEAAHKKWLSTLKPQEIYNAQRARMELSRKGVSLSGRRLPSLDDDRVPKQPIVAWIRWLQANYEKLRTIESSTERVRQAGALWRELSPAERKPFEDAYQADLAVYLKEMESFRKHPYRPNPSA